MKEQIRNAGVLTCCRPSVAEVLHPFPIGPGEYKGVWRLANHAGREQGGYGIRHDDLAAFAVLGGPWIEPDRPLRQVELSHTHVEQFRNAPTVCATHFHK